MNPDLKPLNQSRIVPVVRIDRLELARSLQAALTDGNLPLAEITLRTPCAFEAIEEMAGDANFKVGAGTVLNAEQCKRAIQAGAGFIVSPGYCQKVVDQCNDLGVPCFPGVATATEVQQAWSHGIRVAKFFPSESLGGVSTLKALAGPFHEMRFIPTGGIHGGNLTVYLQEKSVLAVGGSWMVKPELYVEGDFGKVTELARQASNIAANHPLDGNHAI